jgi:hypothetical protein
MASVVIAGDRQVKGIAGPKEGLELGRDIVLPA